MMLRRHSRQNGGSWDGLATRRLEKGGLPAGRSIDRLDAGQVYESEQVSAMSRANTCPGHDGDCVVHINKSIKCDQRNVRGASGHRAACWRDHASCWPSRALPCPPAPEDVERINRWKLHRRGGEGQRARQARRHRSRSPRAVRDQGMLRPLAGSSLPRGIHRPASACLPGVCAISTRLSASTRAQATTR